MPIGFHKQRMIMVILHCAFVYNNEKNKHIRICAITTGSALAGILATLYSDNTVNYSICTLSFPMGFYGMMLGLIHAEKEKKKQKHLDWKMKSFQGFIDAKVWKGRNGVVRQRLANGWRVFGMQFAIVWIMRTVVTMDCYSRIG